MGQQDKQNSRLINARKVAALDIVFHSAKVIFVEFVAAALISGALSVFLLFFASQHTLLSTLLGIYFLGIATNYLALLVFALIIRSRERAVREVESEMGDLPNLGCRYTVQSIIFILIPFAMALLACYQMLPRRSSSL